MVHYQVLNDKLCCQNQITNSKNISGIPHMFSTVPTQSGNTLPPETPPMKGKINYNI